MSSPWSYHHMPWGGITSAGYSSNPSILYFSSNIRERLVYTFSSLCWSLEKLHSMFSRKSTSSLWIHCLRFITLISYQHFSDIRRSMLLDLLYPVFDIIEGFFYGWIISQNDAHCPSVISLGYRSKPLLPRCIPDLQLHYLRVNIHSFDLKINPYAMSKAVWRAEFLTYQ